MTTNAGENDNMKVSEAHRLHVKFMDKIKWILSIVSGLLTTGFVTVLEI